jgi:hypothetical protein
MSSDPIIDSWDCEGDAKGISSLFIVSWVRATHHNGNSYVNRGSVSVLPLSKGLPAFCKFCVCSAVISTSLKPWKAAWAHVPSLQVCSNIHSWPLLSVNLFVALAFTLYPFTHKNGFGLICRGHHRRIRRQFAQANVEEFVGIDSVDMSATAFFGVWAAGGAVPDQDRSGVVGGHFRTPSGEDGHLTGVVYGVEV